MFIYLFIYIVQNAQGYILYHRVTVVEWNHNPFFHGLYCARPGMSLWPLERKVFVWQVLTDLDSRVRQNPRLETIITSVIRLFFTQNPVLSRLYTILLDRYITSVIYAKNMIHFIWVSFFFSFPLIAICIRRGALRCLMSCVLITVSLGDGDRLGAGQLAQGHNWSCWLTAALLHIGLASDSSISSWLSFLGFG